MAYGALSTQSLIVIDESSEIVVKRFRQLSTAEDSLIAMAGIWRSRIISGCSPLTVSFPTSEYPKRTTLSELSQDRVD
jgi:hypothetical protein